MLSLLLSKGTYATVVGMLMPGDENQAIVYGNVATAALIIPMINVVWGFLTFNGAGGHYCYGAICCCCCISGKCPSKRAVLRYKALVLRKYKSQILWRSIKDGISFQDAAELQHNDFLNEARFPALQASHHPLIGVALTGIPFVSGVCCAVLSLMSCEDLTQAVEMFVTG